jgi:hypothetical protein
MEGRRLIVIMLMYLNWKYVDNTKMEVLGEEKDRGQRQVECDKCSFINTCGTGQRTRIGYDLEYQTTNIVL